MSYPERAEGVGIGLRHDLAEELVERIPEEIRWLEIHPENYILRGGRFAENLERAMERWALVPHGLTLCFGNTEGYEAAYLRRLRGLLERIEAPWYSDHLCFGGADGVMLHDLLPLPFNREAIEVTTARVRELRDAIGMPVAIENVSYYASPAPPEMKEEEFLLEVAEGADAQLLLDVNNVWVNAYNHGFEARDYIDQIPPERVVQIHVAGHFTRPDGLIIDTHGEAVREEVYDLLGYTLRRIGPRPVLLERDQNFPAFDELLGEVRRLSAIYEEATRAYAAAQNEDPRDHPEAAE